MGKCIDDKCQCDVEGGAHFKDGRCYEKTALNEPCERSSQCFINGENPDNVECRNSVCKCKVDHAPDVEQQRCLKPGRKGRRSKSFCLLLYVCVHVQQTFNFSLTNKQHVLFLYNDEANSALQYFLVFPRKKT